MEVFTNNRNSRKYQIGYALSGGFIKGFAHLGVMQALLEHDIKPEIISGSYIIREGETLYSFYTATAAGVDPATGEQLYWAWDTDENGVKGKKYITNDMAKATACKEIQGSRIPVSYTHLRAHET